MSRIRIKNFGPIKEGYLENDGWMDIKKVTMFIGNQGSGKSTVAKLISTFMWMEKALNRGDLKIGNANDILNRIYWHNIDDYFHKNTEIEYKGDKWSLSYLAENDKQYDVSQTTGSLIEIEQYVVPKIVYIPAERNFLITIKEAFDLSGLPLPLADFSTELRKAQNNLNGSKISLPINDVNYEFNKQEGTSYISGKGYRLNLSKASSGIQSLVPMYLISRYLVLKIEKEQKEVIPEFIDLSSNNRVRRDEEVAAVWADSNKTDAIKKIDIDRILAKYHNKCFINIVEEPEQNLFPTSQKAILYSLLEFNNMMPGNKLIMTTHSPYLINYLSLAIQGNDLFKKIKALDRDELKERLFKIVPAASCISGSDVAIYEMDETNGTIKKLPAFEGIPSDKNYLNQSIREGNILFDSLLEIEEDL